MPNGRSLPRLVLVGGATAIGGVLIASQVALYRARKRRKLLKKAWKVSPDEHRIAALKITYPGMNIKNVDIAAYDEKAANNLYGVATGPT